MLHCIEVEIFFEYSVAYSNNYSVIIFKSEHFWNYTSQHIILFRNYLNFVFCYIK